MFSLGIVLKGVLDGEAVAVKFYKDGCCSSDGLYVSEIRIALQVHHPNIINVRQAAMVNGKLSAVMDWIKDMEPLGQPPSLEK